MKKVPKSPKASSVLRRQRKKKPNAIIPMAIGLSLLLVVILIGVNASSSKPLERQTEKNLSANTATETSEAKLSSENSIAAKTRTMEKTETKAADKEEVEIVNYNDFTDPAELAGEVSLQSLQALKLEVRQLKIERKWDEAVSFINEYNGPHKSALIAMLEEIETAKIELEKIEREETSKAESVKEIETAANDKDSYPEKETVQAAAKPKKLQPLLKTKDDGRGPNGFLYETDLDRRQAKKGASVSLVVHSKQVGLPQNVIVVWKDRSLVLSYSRLIKKLENRESRFYEERVENAKKFLAENKDRYTLVPYAKAKMSLRRVGFTVSEVFFNETVTDEYNKKTTDRYKGFIISYDLQRSLPSSARIGC